jgi:hypothetical protein
VFAKNQPPYLPLPASVDEAGMVMTEWQPTAADLDRLLCGGRVRLWVHTHDRDVGSPEHPLPPMSVEVIEPERGMRES